MEIQIEIVPKEHEDSEFSTPCLFNFNTIADANNFIRMVLINGDDIAIRVTRE